VRQVLDPCRSTPTHGLYGTQEGSISTYTNSDFGQAKVFSASTGGDGFIMWFPDYTGEKYHNQYPIVFNQFVSTPSLTDADSRPQTA